MLKRLACAILTAALFCAADPANSRVLCKPPDLPVPTRETCDNGPGRNTANDARTVREAGFLDGFEIQSDDRTSDKTPVLFDVMSRFAQALADKLLDGLPSGGPLGIFGGEEKLVPTEELIAPPNGRPRYSELQEYDVEQPISASAARRHHPVSRRCAMARTHTVVGVAGLACAQAPHAMREVQVTRQMRAAARLYEIGMRCEECGDWGMARNCFEEVTRVCPKSEYADRAQGKIAMMAVMAWMGPRMQGGEEIQEPPVLTPPQDLIPESPAGLRRIRHAERMLRMGQYYERTGHLDTAYLCYQEAHMACPSCQHGQLAQKRMQDLEVYKAVQREIGEEQEMPQVERRSRLTQTSMQRRLEARELYLLGERCRRLGDERMAASFYRESVQASPRSYYGVRAGDRLQHIENRQLRTESYDGAEAQELRDTQGPGCRSSMRRWEAFMRDYEWDLDR